MEPNVPSPRGKKSSRRPQPPKGPRPKDSTEDSVSIDVEPNVPSPKRKSSRRPQPPKGPSPRRKKTSRRPQPPKGPIPRRKKTSRRPQPPKGPRPTGSEDSVSIDVQPNVPRPRRKKKSRGPSPRRKKTSRRPQPPTGPRPKGSEDSVSIDVQPNVPRPRRKKKSGRPQPPTDSPSLDSTEDSVSVRSPSDTGALVAIAVKRYLEVCNRQQEQLKNPSPCAELTDTQLRNNLKRFGDNGGGERWEMVERYTDIMEKQMADRDEIVKVSRRFLAACNKRQGNRTSNKKCVIQTEKKLRKLLKKLGEDTTGTKHEMEEKLAEYMEDLATDGAIGLELDNIGLEDTPWTDKIGRSLKGIFGFKRGNSTSDGVTPEEPEEPEEPIKGNTSYDIDDTIRRR